MTINKQAITQNNILSVLKRHEGSHVAEILKHYKSSPQNSKSAYVNAISVALAKNGISAQMIMQLRVNMRSVILNSDNQISESMSFNKIDFDTLKQTEFKDSEIFNLLEGGIILNLFNEDFVYLRSVLISFDESQKEKASKAYNQLRDCYQTNNEKLIRITEDLFMHTRHKDKDAKVKKLKFANILRSDLYWYINKSEIKID